MVLSFEYAMQRYSKYQRKISIVLSIEWLPEGLKFSWISFGTNLLPNQNLATQTQRARLQETSMLDGKNP